MIIGFGNNIVSSLAADITASQTTIQVLPGAGAMFSGLLTYDYANSSNTLKTYAKITLTDAKETVFEVCHLTAVNNDVLTVVRAQEGTTAKGWSLNDVIANFATRGSENQFVQIEQLQSGHYTSGVAGGSANALTLALPATYFTNNSTAWALRTPLVIYPSQNNTGAATLQLTMGGKVLGTYPLYKGNKAQLAANDIIKDVALICMMDNTKTFFSVANPGAIYAGLGTAAFKDIVTSMTDETAGRIPVVGWQGLGGVAPSMPNADIMSTQGVGGRIFKQGNGATENHFGSYGCGLHMLYGTTGDGTNRLTGNLFIDAAGELSVEWLAIKIADGSVTSQILKKWISTSGGTITGDAGPLTLQNKTQGKSLYLLARSATGANRWYIGNGGDNTDAVAFTNYPGGNNIVLNGDGSIDITSGSHKPIYAKGGSVTGDAIGRGSYASQNSTEAAFFQSVNTSGTSEYWPIIKQKYVQGNATWSQGMIINTGDWNVHYISASDTSGKTFTFKKDGQFIPPNYANFDARYQSKGSYYTSSQSDARYIQNVRVGAVGTFTINHNAWSEAPVGAFMTGWYFEGDNPGGDSVHYRPIQIYINGAWRTITT